MQLIPAGIASLKAAMATTAGALQVGGTVLSTAGTLASASSAKATGEFQAKQLEQQEKAAIAASSQEAENRRKQGELVISRARAVGASNGGGIDFDLLGDLEEETDYRVGMAITEGQEAAKGKRTEAAAARFEGSRGKTAGLLSAGGTLLGGFNSLAEKYG